MTTRRRKSATPEGAVLKSCLQLLTLKRIYHWRCNNIAVADGGVYRTFSGLRGVSDILGILAGRRVLTASGEVHIGSGRFLAVECKAPKGWPSEHQRAFLKAAQSAGAVAIVVRDVAVLARVLDRLESDPTVRFTLEGDPVPCSP